MVGRLAVVTDSGPYVVAVNFVFFEGDIYFHSSPDGRKMEALRTDPRVCFLVDETGPVVVHEQGCGISQIYKSVVCFGTARPVEALDQKRRVLETMIRKYVPCDIAVAPMPDQNIERTAVVRIGVESMSGKQNVQSPSHKAVAAHASTTA